MNNFVLPPLLPGDAIGLFAPAAPVEAGRIESAQNLLGQLGYRILLATHALQNEGMVSSSIENRVSDIEELLLSPEVRALWSIRGGYGSIQLLERLPYGLFRKHPRIVVGFSDVTALQMALFARIGLPSVSGLTLTRQVNPDNRFLHWGLGMLKGEVISLDRELFIGEDVQIVSRGDAEGYLIGGTLSLIAALCGTPFFPEAKPIILYLEDVDEPLYRIDRLLWQLKHSGVFQAVQGIILGEFLFRGNSLDVFPLLKPVLPRRIPAVRNFPYGHQVSSIPLPFGVWAQLTSEPFSLKWHPFIG